jgi:flagellar motor switch/type III secretory pathway protein FliN
MLLPRTLERVRPFPWRSLEATTRAEANALCDVRRWATAHLRLDELTAAFAKLLSTDLKVLIGRARPVDDASTLPALDHGVGVLIAPAAAPDANRAALIEAEGALAATVVARALGRPTPRLVDPGVPLQEGIAGAFAAIVLAAARSVHAGVALRVLEAGSAPAVQAALAGGADRLVLSLTVLVADDAFAARIIVPRSAVHACAAPAWDAKALGALGSAPLAVPIVACAMFVTPEEVALLRTGDAVVLPNWPFARKAGAAPQGPVLLAPPSSDLGLRARLCEDGRLVLGAGLQRVAATEAQMDSDEKDAVVATLGEVSVVMRVEIGEALMSAREWASLGRGDVVSLGRRVGELVLLRVGGVPMARGELVELEGEVAVRIVERRPGDWTTT